MKDIFDLEVSSNQGSSPPHLTDNDIEQTPAVQTVALQSVIIHPTTALTWKGSDILRRAKEIRINSFLKEKMKEWTTLSNYVWTVVACHVAYGGIDAVEYELPDQISAELGIDHITVEIFSGEVLRSPLDYRSGQRRPQPSLNNSTIHVLI